MTWKMGCQGDEASFCELVSNMFYGQPYLDRTSADGFVVPNGCNQLECNSKTCEALMIQGCRQPLNDDRYYIKEVPRTHDSMAFRHIGLHRIL